ncbi:thioredoxin family protein [Bacillus pseudomycoides]|uniref:thioredoxin family protein n=1 Tax=Bacillus pseudomycoides TaxID=64104 RepID=UPI000BEB4B21|nr:thioredoxin family protein [Bacillus pseudomycoides]PEB42278.1 hypothetical protein COO06_08180 [Bacillus pseudomycoides]
MARLSKEEKIEHRKQDLLSGTKERRRRRISLILLFSSVVLIIGCSIFSRVYAKLHDLPSAKDGIESVYHTEDLDPATISTLKDPNFKYVINSDMLKEKIEKDSNEKSVYVMFFKADCKSCHELAPKLNEIAKESKVDYSQINVLFYKDLTEKYSLKEVPTVIKFENGKEVERKVGQVVNYKEFIK